MNIEQNRFVERALQAVDDGFTSQVRKEAGGVVERIAGGVSVDEALKNFASIFARTIEARNRARELLVAAGGE